MQPERAALACLLPLERSAVYTWGSTAAERARPFPCDGLVPEPTDALFRAVDVAAPARVPSGLLQSPSLAPHPRFRPRQEKAARHLRYHLLHGAERVARVTDRPPEHEVVGAEPHRLLGRHDALLIVRLRGRVAPRRAHAGRHDQEAAPALAPDARDVERRGDHAVHARLAREAGQAHYLVLDLVGHADAPEVAPAEARQHRDRQDLRPPDGLAAAHARHLGVRALHHLEAARGVEIEEADAEPRRLDAGARHGVRDVVELEVEEHVHPVAVDHAHDLGARMEEELLAHLEDADVLGEQRDQALGLGEGLDVEGEDQPVADAVGPGWEEGPAAGHQAPALRRGPTSAAARAAASATGTSVACLSLRRFNSTAPRASARGPTVSRTGRPIRSASLNLTPGRSSRSSRSVSTPTASSSAASRSAGSPSA